MYQTNLSYDFESNPTSLVKMYPFGTNQNFIQREHLFLDKLKYVNGYEGRGGLYSTTGGYIDNKNFYGAGAAAQHDYYGDGIFSDIFKTVKNIVKKIVPHVKKHIPTIKKGIGQVSDIYKTGKELHQNFKNPLKNIGAIVKNVSNITGNVKDLASTGKDLYDDTLNVLKPVKVKPEDITEPQQAVEEDEVFHDAEGIKPKRKYKKRASVRT